MGGDKHVIPLSTAMHLRRESIQLSDVKLLTKSEERTGCLTLRPLRLQSISGTSGAVGSAVTSAPPAVSTSSAGNCWARLGWQDSSDERSPSFSLHSMVAGSIQWMDIVSCQPAAPKMNVLGSRLTTQNAPAYNGCSGGRTTSLRTKT